MAWYLHQGHQALHSYNAAAAEAAFGEARRATPGYDLERLEQWVAWLRAQSPGAPRAGVSGPTASPNWLGGAANSGQEARNPPGPTTPPELPDEGLYFTINDRPRCVVRVMNDVSRSFEAALATRRGKHWWICLLFPAGLPFVLADELLGLPPTHLSLGAYALWVAGFLLTVTQRLGSAPPTPGGAASKRAPGCAALIALVTGMGGMVALLRFWDESLWAAALVAVLFWSCGSFLLTKSASPSGAPFGTRFDTARALFETIADDLAPKRTLVGWLDLTGSRPSKLVRTARNLRGRKTDYVRDEWLRLKIPLYDGSVLRVSVLENIKKHHGYTKRGRSGKFKHKSAREESSHVVKIALTVDPAAVEVTGIGARSAGGFNLEVAEARDGRVVIEGTAREAPTSRALLDLMACALQHTRRRQAQSLGGKA